MHLLATTSGVVDGGAEALDLRQTPADVVILTAADSELACLAAAHDALGSEAPSLRLANLMQLQHNFSVDLYAEKTLARAKVRTQRPSIRSREALDPGVRRGDGCGKGRRRREFAADCGVGRMGSSHVRVRGRGCAAPTKSGALLPL